MQDRLSYRANGKLLISGEYLVLKGATALAIPLIFGQTLSISDSNTDHISWESHDKSGRWFFEEIKPGSFAVLDTDSETIAGKLNTILIAAKKLNPDFLKKGGICVTMSANYPLHWGLGSSSSLISLISQWAKVDSWELYRHCFNGSGYDLACAKNDFPLFYRLIDSKQEIIRANPGEALKKYSYFAFLGKKQDSSVEVDSFLLNNKVSGHDIARITALSIDICNEGNYDSLYKKVAEHESIISEILCRPTLKEERFPGFPGMVKSLGAWGGDFAMFVSDLPGMKVTSLLKNLGIADTIYTFNELIR
ncbi:MAG: GYDIA family GHMP kinase [Bacteroidota bacterium]